MKVAFVSNYLNHHQLPFCKAMQRLTNGEFWFIATMTTPSGRLHMGYHDMNDNYLFVICTYKGKNHISKALTVINEADIVIAGSAPEQYIIDRITHGKIVFRYSERLYKQGYLYLFAPKRRRLIREQHVSYNNKPVYMLCASSFTAGDFALNGAYKNKCFKWGYFPDVKFYDLERLFAGKRKSNKVSLLWVGRLIKLKHPEITIVIAKKLKQEGYNFELNIIGNGEMEEELKKLIKNNNLESCVHMIGALPPENVRTYMERASIFLLTSDYREGWGAVLNESMNSACAVVASDAVGSTGFLIQDGINGLVVKNGAITDFYIKTKALVSDYTMIEKLGKAAYYTIIELWNPEVAAKRLITLSDELQKGNKTPFKEGPCSVAQKRYAGKLFIK